MSMVTPKIHAALLASPGMGHLIPTMELAKRLTIHHGFEVTVFIVTTDSDTTKTSKVLNQTSNLNGINIVVTPPVDVSDKLDPNNPSLGVRIALTMIESLPFIQSQILSMKFPPSVLIVDLFGSVALPMARDLHMSSYVFFATNAWFSALNIYLPFITKEAFSRHAYNHEPLLIPGCKPVRFEDTLEQLVAPLGPSLESHVEAAKRILSADGILMNTWQDLEPSTIKALTETGILGGFIKGPVYPIGPLVRTVELEEKIEGEKIILSWLDQQPDESVIYLSFGSGGTMSKGQMRELAYGLELSQQRFVWVLRQPMEDNVSAAFFHTAKGGDASTVVDYLPEGFVNRTKEVGICVPMWAPQAEILKHPATGGFVTHCGWNSVLESIFSGVPMVAWPLYIEQKMNATLLSEELGVAVRVKATDEGIICREHIAKLIRRVMVDEDDIGMRVKVKEYKLSGEKTLSVFGSSHESLCQMTKDCKVHLHLSSEAEGHGA
ncbi:UDP-Glycosyltransferase superfamily protein [Trifolium repens]|nr:UDP-Glycosyltransferase superfamily protein [Trifolium repens]KAK2370396.1 UDP-Glycosyltransferase superfamily protein [Trifolium repens]